MKKNRKILAFMLAVLMSAVMLVTASGLEIFIIASSDEYESHATAAKYLEVLDILKGYDDGELHLEEPILRYQAALLFARVVTGVVDETIWGTGASANYTDVPEYGPVMDLISSLKIIVGRGDGTFGYSDGITYQDMCVMLVRVLGYETDETSYPVGYMDKVDKLGIGLKNVMPRDYLNRGQVAQMIYDALTTEISVSNKESLQLVIDILKDKHDGESIDGTKDNYLERNFDVSAPKQFVILATHNYKFLDTAAINKPEKGYFTALEIDSIERNDAGDVINWTEWTFPIEGEATNDVTEADLIGRVVSIMFDDKTPTPEEFDREECAIVHAEMIHGDEFENMGELSYVKFNKESTALFLGNKRIPVAEIPASIYTHSSDEVYVYDRIDPADFEDTINENTYFKLVAYDYDDDNKYDSFVYTPYEFGQYARRRYDGKFYTMVGKYSDAFVYDTSVINEQTEENKTHFVETFLVSGQPAFADLSSYRPADMNVVVGDEGKYSAAARLTGESVATGDFMLYSYNMHSGELNVAVNLGTFQTGILSGLDSGAETYTIDGIKMHTGIPGVFIDENNGLLMGDNAFEAAENVARTILGKYEKGEVNAKYLEYDTKLVYLEAYGISAETAASDVAVIDIEATMKAAREADAEAWDIPSDGKNAIVKRVDVVTGEIYDIKVELLVTHDNVSVNFKDLDDKHAFNTWVDMQGYNLFSDNGAIYAIYDRDDDECYELYAYGADKCNIVGGGLDLDNVVTDGTAPTIEFMYDKSNYFIDPENNAGLAIDRVASNANTVAVIVGNDGFVMHKGMLGTNSEERPNGLYLSDAAIILVANDKQLTIFDPATATVDLYNNDEKSIWYGSSVNTIERVEYYMLLNNSEYVESAVKLDENGDPAVNDDGDILYEHVYKKLYNLLTKTTEDVTVVTTDMEPVFAGIANTEAGVLRVDAENNEAQATTFEEVFVEHDIYRKATFDMFRKKDWITFVLEAKDLDKNNVISDAPAYETASGVKINGAEGGIYGKFDESGDLSYKTLDGLTYTFIDLDEGADVDPEEYNFKDAYLFYQDNKDNRKSYNVVTLEDRVAGEDYAAATMPIKRHMYNGTDYTSQITNGLVTPDLTAGVTGKIFAMAYFLRNNYSDYLIPAVDEDGNTIWSYEGSLRVSVSYHSFAYYDEDTNTLDAVVVRIGKIEGVVGEDVDIDPDDLNEYLDNPLYTCANCSFIGTAADYDEENGNLVCPDCDSPYVERTCDECGYVARADLFEDDATGELACPNCDAEYVERTCDECGYVGRADLFEVEGTDDLACPNCDAEYVEPTNP